MEAESKLSIDKSELLCVNRTCMNLYNREEMFMLMLGCGQLQMCYNISLTCLSLIVNFTSSVCSWLFCQSVSVAGCAADTARIVTR